MRAVGKLFQAEAVGKVHRETRTAVLAHPARDTLMMFCAGADVSFLNVNPQ